MFTLPNGKRINANIINQTVLPDMVADLNNPDPFVRQQAHGQIRMSYALGMLMLLLTNKQFEDVGGEYKKEFLTGGGPNFYTKEGAVQWISMYKNGWRPYSKAVLQYDENGDPKLKNGKPVIGVIYSPISGELFYTSQSLESFKYNFLKKTII